MQLGFDLRVWLLLLQVQDKQGTLRMALGKTGCLLQLSNQASGAFLDVHFSLIAPSSSNAARWAFPTPLSLLQYHESGYAATLTVVHSKAECHCKCLLG